VYQPVEDGVGERGLIDIVMPFLGRQLAGDDGGFSIVTVIEDLEDVAPGLVGHGHEPPVIKDSQTESVHSDSGTKDEIDG
jgi:hypothetical protein